MSYNELYCFEENRRSTGYILTNYLQKDNPGITELDIPSEYKGKPVVGIDFRAFASSRHLISVRFPSTLRNIDDGAFTGCTSLENITFPDSKVYFGSETFYACPKLPVEIQLMSALCSCNLTHPMPGLEYYRFSPKYRSQLILENEPFMRTDVFELAVKNKCFRNAERQWLLWVLETLVENCPITHLCIAADGDLLSDTEIVNALIDLSAKIGRIELTAWLLEHKNRNFGFDGGNKFEL